MTGQREFSEDISPRGYFQKSAQYVRRAFNASANGDLAEYQFWMSLSLELLGKGVLSRVNPALIVKADDRRVMLAALGFGDAKHIQTIGAGETFSRLSTIIPQFNSRLSSYCHLMAVRRNAELHSAASPFDDLNFSVTESALWHSIEILLEYSGLDFYGWLEPSEAEKSVELAREIHRVEELAAESAAHGAGEMWKSKPPREKDKIRSQFKDIDDMQKFILVQQASDWRLNANAECGCPACGNPAIIGGISIQEESSLKDEFFDEDEQDDIMVFESWGLYHADMMKCMHCDLVIKHAHCLRKLGLETSFEKTSTFSISAQQAQAQKDQDLVDMMSD